MPQLDPWSMRDLPDGYTIGLAKLEEIPALISLDKAASTLFEPTGLLAPEALNDHVPADILEHEIPEQNVFVARNQHGWAVGFILIRPRGNGLYLDQVSVHPDHGQQGLGRALVECVITEAERRKLPHVTLSTFRDLPWNGPFYQSLGFRELDRKKFAPYMLEIEEAQSAVMDVRQRCFMRLKVHRPLFRKREPSKEASI